MPPDEASDAELDFNEWQDEEAEELADMGYDPDQPTEAVPEDPLVAQNPLPPPVEHLPQLRQITNRF